MKILDEYQNAQLQLPSNFALNQNHHSHSVQTLKKSHINFDQHSSFYERNNSDISAHSNNTKKSKKRKIVKRIIKKKTFANLMDQQSNNNSLTPTTLQDRS